MAEQSIESPPTPKKTETGRGHERRSETPPITPKKTTVGRGHERRGSTGMLDSPRSGAKILSRYLTASPGSSCHDLCKYGTKHGFDQSNNARDSFRKMVTSKGGKIDCLENAVMTSAEKKKKKLAISPKPCSDSRTQKPSNPVVIKEEVSVENASDHQKLKHVKSKPFASPPVLGSLSIQRNSEIRGKELRTSKNMGEKKGWISPTVYLFPKHSIRRVSGMNSTKNENNVIKIEPKQPSSDVVPEKTLYIIEASTESKTTDLSLSTEDHKSLKHARTGIHGSSSPTSSEKNSLRRTGSGFSAPPPFSSLSIGNKSSRHTLSHSKENGANITGNGEQTTNAEMEYKSRPRKGGKKVSLDFKASPSRKLKFKRGKVVDKLHSDQDSTLRRLKFRRSSVRLVGEIQNSIGNTRKSGIENGTKMKSDKDFRRFKDVNVQGTKRRSSGRKEIGDIENGSKMKSEKVVLKHQNVEGKQRDGQSLYNNVIEETASKLALSRKSKVKALVDAFESVISLQDNRVTSVTTMAC
jgi:hypothetical protein